MQNENVRFEEYQITLDVRGGSSVLGRFLRLITFPFRWVIFGKASL